MPKKKTQQEFELEIQLNHPNIIVSDKYINAKINVHCKCKICNYEWDTAPDNLHSGKGCPKCGHSIKYIHDDFIEKINNINSNIIILSEYKGMKERIKCKCKQCGHEWNPISKALTNGEGCPSCAGRIDSTLDFIEKSKKLNPYVIVIGTYINSSTKILCKCNICNNTYSVYPSEILNGHMHRKCSYTIIGNKERKTQSQFEKDLKSISPTLQILGTYNGKVNKIRTQCNTCGFIWNPSATSLMSGSGCPQCASSKGEKKILTYLESVNIFNVPQKEFDNLLGVNDGLLSYDFYLPTYNLLIEYQGEFHDGTAKQQTKEQFEVQKEHDRRKKQYAIDNKINLLEIWYWDYNNIEEILKDKLLIN